MHQGRVAAIVVAAGRGTRFGAAKQLATVGGRRIVDIAVTTARAACDSVVVVVRDPASWDGDPTVIVVAGGDERSDSVRAGLAAIPDDTEVVVVHDAARPLAGLDVWRAVIDAVRGGADGAIPGVAVVDTIKQVDGPTVVATLARDALIAVQTPQAFSARALRAAHQAAPHATDDAALVEAMGGTVVVVPGDPRNLKITTPTDLVVAEALLDAEDRP